MRCAQILSGFKQCYLTYRIGTFQLTRITLEILTTICIKKIKIQCLSLAAVQFQECLLDNAIGVDLKFYVVARGEGTKGKTCTQLLSGHRQA